MREMTPLIALKIRLQRRIDAPCGACGETVVVIGQGVGPHVASLHCAGCERHRGRLPKAITEFLLAFIEQFGWPPETITIQDSEFAQAKAAALLGAPAAVTTAP
jgi:hypothetical protein